jgi:hypothetical protein
MCALLCSSISSQGTQWWQTFQYPKTFCHLLHCAVSSAKLCYHSLTVTHWSSVMSTSTLCSLHSVATVTVTVVRQIADVPAAILEVFSLNTTHCCHPCRDIHRHDKVDPLYLLQNSIMAHSRYDSSLPAILMQWIMDKFLWACAVPVFQVVEKAHSYLPSLVVSIKYT